MPSTAESAGAFCTVLRLLAGGSPLSPCVAGGPSFPCVADGFSFLFNELSPEFVRFGKAWSWGRMFAQRSSWSSRLSSDDELSSLALFACWALGVSASSWASSDDELSSSELLLAWAFPASVSSSACVWASSDDELSSLESSCACCSCQDEYMSSLGSSCLCFSCRDDELSSLDFSFSCCSCPNGELCPSAFGHETHSSSLADGSCAPPSAEEILSLLISTGAWLCCSVSLFVDGCEYRLLFGHIRSVGGEPRRLPCSRCVTCAIVSVVWRTICFWWSFSVDGDIGDVLGGEG